MVKELKFCFVCFELIEVEFEIFEVLWDWGFLMVVEIVVKLLYWFGYIIVLKLLQIMFGKGWVECDESFCCYVYEVWVLWCEVCICFVGNLFQCVFDGLLSGLVLYVFESQFVLDEELMKIEVVLVEVCRQCEEEIL